eukprot:2570198-Lingulodinium_polyedra.AAC.1
MARLQKRGLTYAAKCAGPSPGEVYVFDATAHTLVQVQQVLADMVDAARSPVKPQTAIPQRGRARSGAAGPQPPCLR